MKAWALGLALVMALAGFNAEAARRLGGGKSFGKQSSNVTQRDATPSQGATNSAATKPAPAGAPAAAASPKRPWGAMLGGLAAGLGLAWLANSLGMGEAFGNVLMVLLFAMLAMAAIRWFMRSRKPDAGSSPFAFQGAAPVPATVAKPYRAENVGNDASARPWERNSMAFEAPQPAAGGSMIGSALMGSQTWGVPAGFDSEGFLRSAKANFITLQAAWDRADVAGLRAMMTDDMDKEIRAQLAERETHTGAGANHTEVVMLEASLLGVEELPDEYMASVEFSGMIREEASAGPSPFREVWNMTKSKAAGSGWLVAGVQALQ
ncbi:MAG: Tim44-like domain-containing protein [Rhodoferax sp.]|nr:Tim44-like domain-containing protein [Rhodoferax sp.]